MVTVDPDLKRRAESACKEAIKASPAAWEAVRREWAPFHADSLKRIDDEALLRHLFAAVKCATEKILKGEKVEQFEVDVSSSLPPSARALTDELSARVFIIFLNELASGIPTQQIEEELSLAAHTPHSTRAARHYYIAGWLLFATGRDGYDVSKYLVLETEARRDELPVEDVVERMQSRRHDGHFSSAEFFNLFQRMEHIAMVFSQLKYLRLVQGRFVEVVRQRCMKDKSLAVLGSLLQPILDHYLPVRTSAACVRLMDSMHKKDSVINVSALRTMINVNANNNIKLDNVFTFEVE